MQQKLPVKTKKVLVRIWRMWDSVYACYCCSFIFVAFELNNVYKAVEVVDLLKLLQTTIVVVSDKNISWSFCFSEVAILMLKR